MACNGIQSGFRILLHVFCDDETQIKCYIYLDMNKMKIIKDIEDHIKAILEIDTVSLFVDDIWLPSCETTHLIKENDTLYAKKTAVSKIISGSSSNVLSTNEAPVKKRRKKSSDEHTTNNVDPIISLDLIYQELQNKKSSLLRKNEKTKFSTPDKAFENFQNEDDEIFRLAPVEKKKRVRKHKKKTIKFVPTRPDSIVSNHEKSPKSFQGTHKRFSDIELDSSRDLEQEIISKPKELPKGSDTEEVNNKNVVQNNIPLESFKFAVPEVTDKTISNSSSEFNISKFSTGNTNTAESNLDVFTENESKENLFENAPVITDDSVSENQTSEVTDWKSKLLSLATINEIESKIFHRNDLGTDNKTT